MVVNHLVCLLFFYISFLRIWVNLFLYFPPDFSAIWFEAPEPWKRYWSTSVKNNDEPQHVFWALRPGSGPRGRRTGAVLPDSSATLLSWNRTRDFTSVLWQTSTVWRDGERRLLLRQSSSLTRADPGAWCLLTGWGSSSVFRERQTPNGEPINQH